MKTFLECIPCFMQQALRTGKIATSDEKVIKKILDATGHLIEDIPLSHTPPETGNLVYDLIAKISGNPDPYKEKKAENMARTKRLQPIINQILESSEDRLLTAIKIAIAGNVIDLGVFESVDIEKMIHENIALTPVIYHFEEFKKELQKVDEILYLADNSSELFFDKFLIKELGKKVLLAVKEKPVINDATIAEANYFQMDEVAEIISSGSTAPGTVLKLCNDEFKKKFYNSKFIISKGQGNFEALSEVDAPIFFLLKAKCPVIARDIGVSKGSTILKYQFHK